LQWWFYEARDTSMVEEGTEAQNFREEERRS
jgi:hypothetical protein